MSLLRSALCRASKYDFIGNCLSVWLAKSRGVSGVVRCSWDEFSMVTASLDLLPHASSTGVFLHRLPWHASLQQFSSTSSLTVTCLSSGEDPS